jgi:hypothetical protein
MSAKPANLDGFVLSDDLFREGDIAQWFYVSETGSRPVLLMHELPGMIPECVALGRKLAAGGFKVYMPLLFGEPGERYRAALLRICWNREFHTMVSGQTSPMVAWLRALLDRMAEENDRKPIGVIGMCLTGNFALTLIAHEGVAAAACCQPALPLIRADPLLAMSPADLAASVKRAATLGTGCILGLRYRDDWKSRHSQWRMVKEAFGKHFNAVDLPGKEHCTLTLHFNETAYASLLEHLHTRLIE